MMDGELILELIRDKESDRIERTISVNSTEKFSEAICAFANDLPNSKLSGYLLVGVHDDGSFSGLRVTDTLLKNLGGLRSEGNILPPPIMNVQSFSYPEGDVAVVEVQPSDFSPVRYKGKTWVRIGPRKATANEAEERILIERRQAAVRTYDTCPFSGATIDDLDLDLFRHKYLPKAVQEEFHDNERPVTQDLASLRLFDTNANAPTVAGLLLLGIRPEYFLPGAYVQYVCFGGVGRESEILREVKFSGNLITILERLDTFIDTSLVEKRPVPVSVLREKQALNYPYWALRELIMNAVMHRDYQSNTPIRLYQFNDRIEIMNAGGLYGNARPEKFPEVNDYRNPVIAEGMKLLGYVNRFSRGVERVNHELKSNGNGIADFNFDKLTVFEVIVKVSNHFIDEQKTTQKTTQKTLVLSENQVAILDIIRMNPSVTREQLAKQIKGITSNGVKYNLDKLRNLKIIERVGGRKIGSWKINNEKIQ